MSDRRARRGAAIDVALAGAFRGLGAIAQAGAAWTAAVELARRRGVRVRLEFDPKTRVWFAELASTEFRGTGRSARAALLALLDAVTR